MIASDPVVRDFPLTPTYRATAPFEVRFNVALHWHPDRPLDVYLLVGHTGRRQVWTVGRDLLIAGLDAPAGVGDVSIMPDLRSHDRRVELVLRGQRGIGHNAALSLPVDPLSRFLDRTRAVVPVGAETVAFDEARLTGDAR